MCAGGWLGEWQQKGAGHWRARREGEGEILEAEGLEGCEAGENRSDGRAAGRSDVVLAAKQGTEIKNRRGSGGMVCVCVRRITTARLLIVIVIIIIKF